MSDLSLNPFCRVEYQNALAWHTGEQRLRWIGEGNHDEYFCACGYTSAYVFFQFPWDRGFVIAIRHDDIDQILVPLDMDGASKYYYPGDDSVAVAIEKLYADERALAVEIAEREEKS